MRQLYLPEPAADNGEYVVTGGDFHYLAHVLRIREGAVVSAGDRDGGRYLLTLEKRESDRLVFRVRSAAGSAAAADGEPELVLVMCLPKPAKMDLIVRMTIELGVSRIVPVTSECGELKAKDIPRLGERTERWRKIARAAFTQSGRRTPGEIESVRMFADIEPASADGELCLYADERGGRPLHALLGAREQKRIRFLVGPEGGLSARERSSLQAKGFVPAHLGGNILRTETAAVILCAAIKLIVSEKASWTTVK
jgi:16S rRNA (uracil1498-N3)-methyltransferase